MWNRNTILEGRGSGIFDKVLRERIPLLESSRQLVSRPKLQPSISRMRAIIIVICYKTSGETKYFLFHISRCVPSFCTVVDVIFADDITIRKNDRASGDRFSVYNTQKIPWSSTKVMVIHMKYAVRLKAWWKGPLIITCVVTFCSVITLKLNGAN